MSTFAQMVDRVRSDLYGYVRDQEQSSHLTSDMAIDALAVNVADAKKIPGTGRIEIGDELIWVDSVDPNTNTLVVPPYGRGFDSTTAAIHTSGTRVISNPLFPRSVVRQEINAAIQDAAGELFAVGSTTFTKNGVQISYQLPAEVRNVLQVTWQVVGPSLVWRRVRRWNLDQADGTSGGTGVAIHLRDVITPGRTVKVLYSKYAQTMTNDTDDFVAVTGLPQTSEDVIVYGACARLLSYLDTSRVDTQSTEAAVAASGVPVGSATNLSKQMYGMFRQRLTEEKDRLLATYPTSVHYSQR